MTSPTYRALSFEERFFNAPTIVNVPYSVPPEKLPAASTQIINTLPPAPDLSLTHLNMPKQQSKLIRFVSKNWLPIVGVSAGVILIYWVHRQRQDEQQKGMQTVASK